MVVRLLGSAAGGGVPQWNCACRQCAAARAGLIEERTQCSVAVSADSRRWFLINASPDLRLQLLCFKPNSEAAAMTEGFPPVISELTAQPPARQRETPIESVLLTDADLDHTLGLFLLRESDSAISIHSSKAVREALDEGLRTTEILGRYCGIRWIEAPPVFAPILCRDGTESGLEYKAVEIEGPGPRYWRENDHGSCRLFYVLRQSATGKSILIAPAVANLEPRLLAELSQADAILMDGTFWASDDFDKSGVLNLSAAELLKSHLPMVNGSLETLAALPAKQKVYIHINNTNPVLWEHGPERKQLDEFGIQLAVDGMVFEV
jgi:pyrroloquinoline quinone biosynthesis protein B